MAASGNEFTLPHAIKPSAFQTVGTDAEVQIGGTEQPCCD